MKALILILLPFTLFGQAAPKKTNTILVRGVGFSEAVRTLIDNGYFAFRIDSNYHTITTEPKNVKKATSTIILNIAEKDSVLTIRGTFTDAVSINVGGFNAKVTDEAITNTGMKGRAYRLCFEEMDRIAKSFNKPVEYQIR